MYKRVINRIHRSCRCLLIGFFVFWNALSAPLSGEDGEDFFEKKIRPILVKHCYECHSDVNSEGGLLLDSRQGWQKGGDSGPVIVPGKPDDSLLMKAIGYQDENLAMPPKAAGGKLNPSEIAALKKWIGMGAPDPRTTATKLGGMSAEDAKSWWAFQPLPKSENRLTSAGIDALIDQGLAKLPVKSLPPADKKTLIRRATYGLTGLPPTPEAVASFLADQSPNAFAKVVDRLLSSEQYGVHWGRHWLDVVRYADTAGENTDRPLPHAWRYRNWVFKCFNDDTPFNEFVRLQLAGDLIRADQTRDRLNEGIIATGYLAIARRFGHDIDKRLYLMHEDVIDNVGKNLLGLTTGCARCHDHKYDPITMQDYYALYGIFQSTRFSFPGCEPKGQPRDLIPLLSRSEIEKRMKPWNARVAQLNLQKEKLEKSAKVLRSLFGAASRKLLDRTLVNEGATVPIKDLSVKLHKGEVLQLTIHPNGSHGADSTRIQWRIQEQDGKGRHWDVEDLVHRFTAGNPLSEDKGATWCFLESTNGPAFLTQRINALPENKALKAWKRTGDALSVFVNTSDQAVKVWTTLPPKAFFAHPEHNRPVSVAFVSPFDGAATISGAITDAQPIGSDGVSFELIHIASNEYGRSLVDVGQESSKPVTEPGPKPDIPVAYAVCESSPINTKLQRRGDPEQLGDEVPRRWLSVFGGQPLANIQESGRRELAEWISKHPLMARVIVNRVWQWHFGQGLVSTPNNFGSRGEAPSHPELLDSLATEFIANGYRVKKLHQMIMQTRAYQRSSDCAQEWLEQDPGNRLLGHFSRRRLSAEEIRDSLLQVSGNLELTSALKHPFPDESTWTFTQHNPFNAVYQTNRRSAFLMVQRQHRHPFLALFDGADPNASTAARETSTVPTQALYFLNDSFFHDQAAGLSERMSKYKDFHERISQTYRVVFQRNPTKQELATAAEFFDRYPANAFEKWRAYARVLLASNEFIHVD